MADDSKRSKVCDTCKAKKVKCDRRLPSCGYCEKHNLVCKFSYPKQLSESEIRRISEKVAELDEIVSDNRDLLQSIQDLDSRVKQLEKSGEPDTTKKEKKEYLKAPDVSVYRRCVREYFELLYAVFPLVNPLTSKTLYEEGNPVLNGIAVLCLDFCSDILEKEEIEGYYDFCKGQILSSCIGLKDVDSLRALGLLAFKLLGQQSGEFEMVFLLVKTGCQKLNLLKESAMLKEDERQLVWSLYVIDKINLFVNKKLNMTPPDVLLPISFNKVLSGVELAQTRTLNNGNYEDFNDSYDSFTFSIEILSFLSRAYILLLENESLPSNNLGPFTNLLQALKDEVTTWEMYLPEYHRNFLHSTNFMLQGTLAIQDVLLYFCYNMYLITVHMCFYFDNDDFFQHNMEIANMAANRIIHLGMACSTLFNTESAAQFGYIYILALWVACRTTNIINRRNSTEYEFVLNKVSDLAEIWPLAKTYKDAIVNLKLYDESPKNKSLFDIFKISTEEYISM